MKVCVVGVGRPRHGDDAAGLLVARRLARGGACPAQIMEETGSGMALLDAMHGADVLLVVDAALDEEGPPVGTWHRFELGHKEQVGLESTLRDSHTLTLGAMLRLGAALYGPPPEVHIYALFGKHFAPECDPCPEVAAAVEQVAEAIEQQVRQMTG